MVGILDLDLLGLRAGAVHVQAPLAARLAHDIMRGDAAARERYLTLLKSGGNDYPMEQLKKAGVDLAQPDTVRAVIAQLDDLVSRLERELAAR